MDNSWDACEELGHIQEKRNEKVALPEITINVKALSDNYQLIGEKQSIGQMIVKKNEFTILYKGNSQSKQIRGGNLSMSFEDVTFNVSESNGKISVLMNGTQLRLKKNAPIFLISIMDNGPGIIESKIPDIFGRMLYGSKFQSMRQSRGQQGIGIHSAVLYSQLTTGKPATIVSKVKSSKKAKMMKVQINILKNEPEVLEEKEEDFPYESGTRIDLEIEGIYISSNKGLDEYVRRTALVNPHATIIYINPNGEKITYKRVIERLPKEPVSIKPHPEGLEMGIFMRILKNSTERTVIAVLENELSRVSRAVADQVLKSVGIDPKLKPQEIDRVQANSILKALQSLDLMRPQTDCLSPIGGEELEKSLKKEYSPEFIKSVTRKPEVYRGMPFQIEVAAAYGGEIKSDKAMLMRFANKIPLLFDSSSCALTQSFLGVDYSRYGLKVENKVPVGQLVFIIHIASVWVPYTNESKNSVASYPVITKEIKLALQELVRNLSVFLNRKHKSSLFQERINLFDKYGIELAYSLSKLTDIDEKKIKAKIENMLEKKKDEVKKNVEESLSKGDVISSKIESDASSEEE
ncbi:MAG: DNA topoisomerase (ATP-hydrolyzing) [Candidatus Parvarchaeum acidophilus ARMAN-5]|uniref:Type 2 DNA topoisomerase 6 subunit B n=1 Tax=Candidatus Parvarchaeum acidophilus ARMAN-5 TaxID=662762 RepID=D6GWL4_PARA5|nr:MAG: DNA topoisomerase (ATP-hydrolyzing) [Candidatus Parvarchaeum acidophilus ARMAN-5]